MIWYLGSFLRYLILKACFDIFAAKDAVCKKTHYSKVNKAIDVMFCRKSRLDIILHRYGKVNS